VCTLIDLINLINLVFYVVVVCCVCTCRAQLTRKSAITALCMYDRDDVDEAQRSPGAFPNIDLLHRVYNEGLELEFCVQEFEV